MGTEKMKYNGVELVELPKTSWDGKNTDALCWSNDGTGSSASPCKIESLTSGGKWLVKVMVCTNGGPEVWREILADHVALPPRDVRYPSKLPDDIARFTKFSAFHKWNSDDFIHGEAYTITRKTSSGRYSSHIYTCYVTHNGKSAEFYCIDGTHETFVFNPDEDLIATPFDFGHAARALESLVNTESLSGHRISGRHCLEKNSIRH